jgi:hypothetical protein
VWTRTRSKRDDDLSADRGGAEEEQMETTQNRYLELMNFKSSEEAYAQVRDLASQLTNDQHLIRSCIFDLHAIVEVELRRVFYHTFKAQLFLTDDEIENKKTIAKFGKTIGRLGFMHMYRILQPVLNTWPYPELQYIEELNDTRSAAAHGGVEGVSYKGRNPFNDADCFAQMYFDVWAIKQSMARYFDFVIATPRRRLKRYVDKYGTGELW